MTSAELKALAAVLAYMAPEQKDFETSDGPDNHIWRDVQTLIAFQNKQQHPNEHHQPVEPTPPVWLRKS